MVNCKVSDIKLPILVPQTKFKLSVQLVGKVAGTRKMVNLVSAVITGETKKL